MKNYARRYWLTLAVLPLMIGLLFYAYRLEGVAKSTNQILKKDLEQKDAEIAALSFVLNEQAVPYIVYTLEQCRKNKQNCVQLLLSPNEPPFSEQLGKQQQSGG